MAAPQLYRTRMCRYYKNGICFRGPECHYAHSEEELRPISRIAKSANKNPPGAGDNAAADGPAVIAPVTATNAVIVEKPVTNKSRWRESNTNALKVDGMETFGAAWKLNSSAALPSSSMSTTSSSQSRLSEAEEIPPRIPVLTTTSVIMPPAVMQDHNSRQLTSLCQGLPCQQSIEMMFQQRPDILALGVPICARALGLPLMTIASVEKFLAIPYDL